ncbi:MAG: putative DNA binding domain-containing protein [Roseburia sp.]|nr:putative DNA binding domain-containing protein [Roseburia sp.]
MTEREILELIKKGKGATVEFKMSTDEITEDIYNAVCALSNQDGGHIFLGVTDKGEIAGVSPDAVEQMKKDFFTTINNTDKLYPPLYLSLDEVLIDERIVLYVDVPAGTQVCRYNGKIYERSRGADVDVTNDSDAVFRLYARKQDTYFVDKVTDFKLADLRPDLIDRARRMSRIRNMNHPWLTMGDEELLRSAGLILKDNKKRREGLTLAAILLFGKDITILSALPQHKTDAIFRVENLDHYDDRDVIITNLFDTYDRLMEFGKKHLSDPFALEGIHSVSSRDKILREIFTNLLAHRDYSSAYVAKFVIEKDQMYTENASRAHGSGKMSLSGFEPFSKNPAISRVFRETSLADELGSGMRNTYKYTEMYSGGVPQFMEGNVFRTVIPLNDISVGRVGPRSIDQRNELAGGQDGEQFDEQADEQFGGQLSEPSAELDVKAAGEPSTDQAGDLVDEQISEPESIPTVENVKNKDVFQRFLTFLKDKI